jgi:hypothetical protein
LFTKGCPTIRELEEDRIMLQMEAADFLKSEEFLQVSKALHSMFIARTVTKPNLELWIPV